MSKQAFKRVRKALGLPVSREELPNFTDVGCYCICYVFRDGGQCCAECANEDIDLIDEDIKNLKRWNSHGGWALDGYFVIGCDVEPDDSEDGGDNEYLCDHCGKNVDPALRPDKELEAFKKELGFKERTPWQIVYDRLLDLERVGDAQTLLDLYQLKNSGTPTS